MSFRVTPSQYAELDRLAEEKGVDLNDAFLNGARQYLTDDTSEVGRLRSSVEAARRALADL